MRWTYAKRNHRKDGKMKEGTVNRQLVGEAGVHFVISEITLRGLIAVATSRNVKGPDVIVTNTEGTKFAAIQVKTRRNTSDKFWNVGDRGLTWGGPDCWYVFVRINNGKFEAFMVPAKEVRRFAKADLREQARRKTRSFGASWGYGPWFIRLFNDEEIGDRARQQWKDFDLLQKAKKGKK
jgi:hypothetical protein